MFRRALAIADATLAPAHPSRAVVTNNLALVLEAKGQYADAVLLYRKALAIFDAALGPEHAYTRDAEVCLEKRRRGLSEVSCSCGCWGTPTEGGAGKGRLSAARSLSHHARLHPFTSSAHVCVCPQRDLATCLDMAESEVDMGMADSTKHLAGGTKHLAAGTRL